jgi:allose kinase
MDKHRRRIFSSTNFPGLDNIDMVDILEQGLEIPVSIQHDAYYLLAYDIFDYGILNEGTLVGLYFGTGMGNGIFINGKPYIGKNGTMGAVPGM